MLHAEEIHRLGCRIKQRDRKAFHILYLESFTTLQRYAVRYVYDWEEAQEIVQEAFLSLWANLDSYHSSQNILAYLSGIVHNLCSNYLRHLNIVDSHQDKIVEAMLFAQMEDWEFDESIKQRLRDALKQLPEKSYYILMRHIVQGKKNSEIAQEMGIAESTVKTHLKRALRILREQLLFLIFFG